MEGNLHTVSVLEAKTSKMMRSSTMQRFGSVRQPMPPLAALCYPILPHSPLCAEIKCLPAPKPWLEPLDLSKSAIPSNSYTHKSDSILQQMLTQNSKAASNRKRSYSCLSTAERLNRQSRDSSKTDIRGAFSMDETPDNPVILVELFRDTATVTIEKFFQSLVRMVGKVFTISQFSMLPEQEKVALLQNSWHRLMLWSLASDAFTFSVSPLESQPIADFSILPSYRRHPTMAFVRGMSVFMKKFASLCISDEEFTLLFGITLFHTGKPSLSTQSMDNKRKDLMRQLQTLVLSNSSEPNRYTDLLLCLPLLYSVDEGMFENLFCSKEFGDVDIKLLLKDAVRQATQRTGSI